MNTPKIKNEFNLKMVKIYFILQIILLVIAYFVLPTNLIIERTINGLPSRLTSQPVLLLLASPLVSISTATPITNFLSINVLIIIGIIVLICALILLQRNKLQEIKCVSSFLKINLVFLWLLGFIVIVYEFLNEDFLIILTWLLSIITAYIISHKTKAYLKNLQGQK